MKTYVPRSQSRWDSSPSEFSWNSSFREERSQSADARPLHSPPKPEGDSKAIAPPKPWGAITGNVKRSRTAQAIATQPSLVLQAKMPAVSRDRSPAIQVFRPPLLQQKRPSAAIGTGRTLRAGLPERLKTGVESLSGVSMDDVRVHYRSPKPTQLNAFAYTRGTDIHIAPGQEKHLAHEAWHVVQQKQGRVRAQTASQGQPMNTDKRLEREADVMGAKARQYNPTIAIAAQPTAAPHANTATQVPNVLQMKAYPQLELADDYMKIGEIEYGKNTNEEKNENNDTVGFENFSSCLGVVGKDGDSITGVHLVINDGTHALTDPLDNNNEVPAIILETASKVAHLIEGSQQVVFVGFVEEWKRRSKLFMDALRAFVGSEKIQERDVDHTVQCTVKYTGQEWKVNYRVPPLAEIGGTVKRRFSYLKELFKSTRSQKRNELEGETFEEGNQLDEKTLQVGQFLIDQGDRIWQIEALKPIPTKLRVNDKLTDITVTEATAKRIN